MIQATAIMMQKIIKNPFFLLAIVFIVASFLRFYQIAELPPGFYPDEAMYANNGVEAWETGHFKIFYPENFGREGLWPNIIGFFIVKFGHEPWIPRSIAAIFGTLTVLGIYFLTKELFLKKIALLASFLVATSFWHINFSRIGFRAIMAPFFLVWGVYFLLLALRKAKDQKSSIFCFLASIFSGLFYGLGFHTYIAYRATPLLILIILFSYWFQNKEKLIRKKILLSTFYFLFSTIIVAAPLLFYFLQNPRDFFGRTSQISVFSSTTPIKDLGINILKTAGMFNFIGDENWRHNYAGRPELFWPVGILFLLGIFLGIKSMLKRIKKREYAILFGWLIVAILPVIISNESLPHALRALLMIPPVFILAGVGGLWFYEKIKSSILNRETDAKPYAKLTRKIFLFSIFYFLLSILVFEAYYVYFIKWGQNPNVPGAFSANYVGIGRQLNTQPKALPKYVVVEARGADVRGLPMPTQTVMFITDTFTPEKQEEKNIFYVLPEQINQIPENGYTVILK